MTAFWDTVCDTTGIFTEGPGNKGWANYYATGYPRKAFRDMNQYVRKRLQIHLSRRSQRPYKLPKGQTYYQHLNGLGLIVL